MYNKRLQPKKGDTIYGIRIYCAYVLVLKLTIKEKGLLMALKNT